MKKISALIISIIIMWSINLDAAYSPPPPKMPGFEDVEEEIKNWKDEEITIRLDDNYPNPFSSLTEIKYFISQQESVKLKLYDLNGKEVSNLIDKYVKPGWNTLIVNGSGLKSGIYLLKFECNNKIAVKKINKID